MQEKEKGRKRKMRTKAKTKKESEIWELINRKKKKKAGK